MPLKKEDLPVKNEFGDNGWFKIGPQAIPHFYFKQHTLCGVTVTSQNRNHLITAEDDLHHCGNCVKVRRNQLKNRMGMTRYSLVDGKVQVIKPKSHSLLKPQ